MTEKRFLVASKTHSASTADHTYDVTNYDALKDTFSNLMKEGTTIAVKLLLQENEALPTTEVPRLTYWFPDEVIVVDSIRMTRILQWAEQR